MKNSWKVLTTKAIENAKPKAERYEIGDGAQRGMYLVVYPSGAKSFICRYRLGSKKKLTFPGVALPAARKLTSDALFKVAQGIDPSEEAKTAKRKAANAAADTVEVICKEYLKREGKNLRTVDQRETLFERLVYPAIGSQPIDTIMRSQLTRLLDKIEDDAGARTADLALAYLRKVFNWHALRSDSFKSPIIKGMGRYSGKEHERDRFLTDDEIRAIWKATEQDRPGSPFVRFLLLTGCRRSEAAGLCWSEIKDGLWNLPAARNKVKKDLERPLSQAALAIINAQSPIVGSPLVFQNIRSFSLVKQNIDAASGITGWRLHDLRRSARTLLSRAGVNADVAERCLGHVIGGVRGVYDRHRYVREMRDAFEALAGVIDGIIHPRANVTPMVRKGRRASS
jgi:integrase